MITNTQKRLIILLPAALLLFAAGCSRTKIVEATDTSHSDPGDTLTVAVAKAAPQDLSRDIVLTAEFKPYQEVDVMAKVAGYVKEIRVDAGDRVRQGDLLATLEVPEMIDDLQRSEANLQRSNAEVARAREEIQRAISAHEMSHLSYTRLAAVSKSKPGLVAQQEVDDAQSRDLVSEAQIEAARSSLAAAEQQVNVAQAEQDKVKTLMNYTRVTAPFTGVITKRFADTGSMIQAGTASQTQAMPLVRLSQNNLLRLILPVPESVVPHIHAGSGVEVHVSSLNRSFPGKVARFADRVQVSTRTMDTEVDVPNPELVLVPGMYAEVNLVLEQHNAVLAIPVAAVAGTEKEPAVYLVTSGNRIEIHRVSLGLETPARVEVHSGLREGDLVVIGNRGQLTAGELVKPKITELKPLRSE